MKALTTLLLLLLYPLHVLAFDYCDKEALQAIHTYQMELASISSKAMSFQLNFEFYKNNPEQIRLIGIISRDIGKYLEISKHLDSLLSIRSMASEQENLKRYLEERIGLCIFLLDEKDWESKYNEAETYSESNKIRSALIDTMKSLNAYFEGYSERSMSHSSE